ncbi:MAG: BLUF domain-containing protein [Limnohabitans sp.]
MSTLNDLAYLSYCSQAQFPMRHDEIERILKTSQRNNQHDEITGLLTFSGEVFVQFLEGTHAALQNLMDRIQNDTRHNNIIILSEGGSHERMLAGWDMELVTPK